MQLAAPLALLGLATGCLPRGPAPSGEHVLPTRAVASVQFLSAPAGQPRRLLVAQDRGDRDGVDLSISDLSQDGHAGPMQLLAERIDGLQSTCFSGWPCRYLIDTRGRIYLRRSAGPREEQQATEPAALIRIDLGTRAVEELGQPHLFEASPSGDRIVLNVVGTGQLRVMDAGGRVTPLTDVLWSRLIGEELFFL